jgi:hypothetical protein
MKLTSHTIILLTAILLLFYNILLSQSFYLQSTPGYDYQIGMCVIHPFLIKEYDQSIAEGNYDLYCNLSLNHELSFVSSIPIIYYSGDPNKNVGFGNIYLGVQTQYKKFINRGSVFSLGITLPTSTGELYYFNKRYLRDYYYPYDPKIYMPENLSIYDVGQLTNFYDVEKYLPGVVSAYGNYAYHAKLKYLLLGAEAGIKYSQRKETVAFFMHQGCMIGVYYKIVSFQVEFTNIIVVFNDLYKLDSPFIPALTIGTQIFNKMIRPGIFYTMNINRSISDFSKGSLGIRLDFSINKPINHH